MGMIVVALAVAAAIFFGLALVVTQAGLRHVGPLQGSCIAIPTATALFVALAPLTVDLAAWDARGAAIFALVGCLFPAAVTILTFYANRRIGPGLTGALGNLAPLFAVALAVAALGETPRPGQLAAIVIIVAGVVLLYRAPRAGGRDGAGWAFALPLAAAFIRGLVQPMVKLGLAGWPNPFAAVTIGYLVSSAVVLGAGAVRARGWPLAYDRSGWLWFALVGLCNGLAVLCLYQALARGPVTVVAPLVACYPLATLAFGRAARGTPAPTRHTVIGIAVTVAGVALLLAG